MAVKWTKEQQKVIDYRNRNILVSAAAGSGKTAVLVERIIHRILEDENPVDIDKLLVVTFTKAAAAEMRERIAKAIENKRQLANENGKSDENLERQASLIHNAQITTIDAFCLFIVRNHFEEINLEPDFRIADSGEITLLENEVIAELFEVNYGRDDNTAFLNLIDSYSSGRNDTAVRELVLKIYHEAESASWPLKWISSLSENYHIKDEAEFLQLDMVKELTEYVRVMMAEYKAQLEDLLEKANSVLGLEKYAGTIAMDLELLAPIDDIEDFSGFKKFFDNFKLPAIAAIRGFDGDEAVKEAVKSGRNGVKDGINSIISTYFTVDIAENVEQIKRMAPIVDELVRLALEFNHLMDKRKREKRIATFSDIEHFALKILVNEETMEKSEIARQFSNYFEEIMIDEYQDSNQVQEDIMTAISRCDMGQNNMFMVGDVKQSIYRFRQAKPELFMEKYDCFDMEESVNQRIDLHKNFRSRREVIDFSNDIFYKIMSPDLGRVSYDEEAALYCGADYTEAAGNEPEIMLVDLKDDEVSDVLQEEEGKAVRIEALMVAKRIQKLVESGQVTDKETGALRQARYSDIVILSRSLSAWGAEFADVLKSCGVPAHITSQMGYFSAYEVQIVLAMLKILDNPYQDIPMAAVLKSPIVGMDDEELAQIKVENKGLSFSKAVVRLMNIINEKEYTDDYLCGGKTQNEQNTDSVENIESIYGVEFIRFARVYGRLREAVSDTPIHSVIQLILDMTGFGDYVVAMPSGKRRKQNLDMLLEMAINYESTSYKGLFHFVKYIETLQKYEVDFGEAETISENDDVVRIMTIHKSKGLEFPIVFVSGLGKKINQKDSQEALVLHSRYGLGITEMIKKPRAKTKQNTMIRSEIARNIKYENLGEELRVLYVALTRAKEKIILTGTVKDYGKTLGKYTANVKPMEPISFIQRSQAQTYLDWILPAVLSYPDKYDISLESGLSLAVREAEELATLDIKREELMKNIESADSKLTDSLSLQFDFEYAYKSEANKKSKYSVSELKHDSMLQNYDYEKGEAQKPDFLQEKREHYIPDFISEETSNSKVNRGALRGTAIHRVMECIDFKMILDLGKDSENLVTDIAAKEFVDKEIGRMLSSKLIDEEMHKLIIPTMICKFIESDVALSMARADKEELLFKEKPFVMDYEGALLQGIIDVFWLENNEVTVLDYKTDKVDSAEELIMRYKTQLDIYGDALTKIFSVEKSKKLIYSFCLQEVIEIE